MIGDSFCLTYILAKWRDFSFQSFFCVCVHFSAVSIQSYTKPTFSTKYRTGALKLHRKHFQIKSETVKKWNVLRALFLPCDRYRFWYLCHVKPKIIAQKYRRSHRVAMSSYQILLSHILFTVLLFCFFFFVGYSSVTLALSSLFLLLSLYVFPFHFIFFLISLSFSESPRELSQAHKLCK